MIESHCHIEKSKCQVQGSVTQSVSSFKLKRNNGSRNGWESDLNQQLEIPSLVYAMLIIHVSKLTNMESETCVRKKSAPTFQTSAAVHSSIVIVW